MTMVTKMNTEVEELKKQLELYKEYVEAADDLFQVLLDFSFRVAPSSSWWEDEFNEKDRRVFELKCKLEQL